MKMQAKNIFSVVIILAMSTIAMAQPPGGGQRQEMRAPQDQRMAPKAEGERMMRMLDLSDEQKEQMKAIKTDAQMEILPLKNSLAEKEARLVTLQTASNVDMKAIEKQIEEIGQVKVTMAKIKARSHQKVRALLTDDQRIKLDMKLSEGKKKGKGPAKQGKGR
ncbi:MAG: periplasmic heavy metal sensor [Cyclobacteriaceae bacterium]